MTERPCSMKLEGCAGRAEYEITIVRPEPMKKAPAKKKACWKCASKLEDEGQLAPKGAKRL